MILSICCAAAQGVSWGSNLPPVLLLHGTADTCALVSNATQFAKALQEAGAQARAKPAVYSPPPLPGFRVLRSGNRSKSGRRAGWARLETCMQS